MNFTFFLVRGALRIGTLLCFPRVEGALFFGTLHLLQGRGALGLSKSSFLRGGVEIALWNFIFSGVQGSLRFGTFSLRFGGV